VVIITMMMMMMMMIIMRNGKLKRILIFMWKELKSACEQMKADEKDSSIHCNFSDNDRHFGVIERTGK
jgi:chitinase